MEIQRMNEPTVDKAAQMQRTGKILLVFGLVMLATGSYLWIQGTTLAPVVIIFGFADLAAGGLLIFKGRPSA
jgi:hypothetical protein